MKKQPPKLTECPGCGRMMQLEHEKCGWCGRIMPKKWKECSPSRPTGQKGRKKWLKQR